MWACVFGSWLGFFIFGNNEKLLIANMLVAILVALSRIIFLLNKVD
jgi:cell division protein FtsL